MNSIGFITIAQNYQDINYLEMAYLQAMNTKLLHPKFGYAVIVDKKTGTQITDKMRLVFDTIIEMPINLDMNGKSRFANEVQTYRLTPFKESIKLESDLLFTRPIDHWVYATRLKDVCLSYNCKNIKEQNVQIMKYRDIFEKNDLPNIYNGLMYFQKTKAAYNFFNLAQEILSNWAQVKELLINCYEEYPTTDVLYALTAKIYGIENCTIPTLDFFNFVHMKPAINEWGNVNLGWTELVSHQREDHMIRINNLNQYYPVHYYDKSYCNNDIIKLYEELYEQQFL